MSAMPYLKNNAADNPVTYKVYKEGINLPTFFDLTEDDVAYISKTVRHVLQDVMILC
jgi:dTDP-4-amino-4,6-dideoxygalactose transaminase